MNVPPEIGHACAVGQVGLVEAWLNSDSAHHPNEADQYLVLSSLLFTAAQSPLSQRGGCDMIRMLMAKGATVEARCDEGWTPLMHAASVNNIDTMETLIDTYGANIHAESHNGYTVLMIAVENGWHSDFDPEGVLFLLRRGAKCDQRNHRGDDAEAIAARNHQITQFVLAEVKAGGGCIKKYLREPIISLNCLRLLCERGRATAPSGVLATLMGPKLPRELFVYVLSFWRSARALDDRAFDRVRGRYLPTRYDYWYSYEAPDEVIMG